MAEKEYIARGEMLTALKTGFFPQDVVYTEAVSIADQIIRSAPAVDVVEVVRCKDCVYGVVDSDGGMSCDCFSVDGLRPDGYCSFGERKDSDG